MEHWLDNAISKWTEIYEKDKDMDFAAALWEVRSAATAEGENSYVADLKLLHSMGEFLPKHYRTCGFPEYMATNALEDLGCKAQECEKMYGVTGTCCAEWQWGFFNVTRFALGRLQFEPADTPKDFPFPKDRDIINTPKIIQVHIPGGQKLIHAECLDAYRSAVDFFEKYFQMEHPLFACDSWLLTPAHEELLPSDSNILAFQRDYHVYDFVPGYGELWRIFYKEYDGHPENLQEKTSLQRIYKNWMISGGVPGLAKGMLNPKEIL